MIEITKRLKPSLTALIVSGLLIFLCFSLVTCTEVQSGKKVTLRIDWVPEPTYYGIFYAKERGLFQKAGFDVTIQYGKGAPSLANEIGMGTTVVGTTSSDNILAQIAKGRKYALCAPLLKFNPFAILSLDESPIRELKDLEGKRLGVNVESVTYIQYRKALESTGIDPKLVQEVPVGWSGNQFLINRQVDASLGYITNHGVDLEWRNIGFHSILAGDLKPPMHSYGLVLAFAIPRDNGDNLTEKEMYLLADAVLKGYKLGAEDKVGTAQLMKNTEPSLEKEKTEAGIEMVAKLNFESKVTIDTIDKWKTEGISEKDRQVARSLYRFEELKSKYQ